MVGVQFGLDTVEFPEVGGWGGWISVAEGVSTIRFRQLEMVRVGFESIDTAFAFFQDSVEVGGQTSKRTMSSAMSESRVG